MAEDQNWLGLARAGDIDALLELADKTNEDDGTTYRWLLVAADCGHEDADDAIADILETTDLRYDDCRDIVATSHWLLARAYLEGGDGLRIDLELADRHLGEAFEDHTPERIGEFVAADATPVCVRDRLSGAAAALMDRHLSGDLHNRVIRLIAQVQRLRDVGAPASLRASMERILRDTANELFETPNVDPGPWKVSLEQIRTMVDQMLDGFS